MAGRMMRREMFVMIAQRWAVPACCLLACASFPLHAEDLPDPTRPPAIVFSPSTGHTGADGGNHSSGLQMVIISKTRRAAIIDGQTVELWGTHSNARLIEVNEGGVVLQRGQKRQVLALFPGVKIMRKDIPDKPSGESTSSNDDVPGFSTSPTNKMQSNEDNSRPTAQKEEK